MTLHLSHTHIHTFPGQAGAASCSTYFCSPIFRNYLQN